MLAGTVSLRSLVSQYGILKKFATGGIKNISTLLLVCYRHGCLKKLPAFLWLLQFFFYHNTFIAKFDASI
jgi:hypothetical protein